MKLKPIKPLPGPNAPATMGVRMPDWIPRELIREHFEKYRAGLAAAGVVLSVLVVFGLLYVRHRHTVAVRAAVLYRDAYNVYSYRIPPPGSETVPLVGSEEEKYQRAMQAFQQLSDTYPGATLAPAALYFAANCRYRLRQYSQALETFDQFLARYPGHRLAVQARLGRGDSLEQLSRYQEAVLEYQQVINSGSALGYEGSMGAVRCLLRMGESDRTRAAEAMALLTKLGLDSGPAAKSARSLRKLLADITPGK